MEPSPGIPLMSAVIDSTVVAETLSFVNTITERRPSSPQPVRPLSAQAGKRAAQDSPYWVEAFEDINALAAHHAAWQGLADHTIETNPFYEPWMFVPAWKAFGHEAPGTKFVLVWQRNPKSGQPPILAGFVPLMPRRGFGGLPVRFHRTWQHPFCYLCAPLLRRGVQHETLTALLDWMKDQKLGLLKLRHVPAEGLLNQTLLDVTSQRDASVFFVERFNRALLQRADSADDYIAASMSHHQRHELERKQRRLAELGRLEVRRLGDSTADSPDFAFWLRTFLEVEQLGWKGREATALGSDPVTREYFETICREAHARGRLMMLGMFLDDRPIAAKCNFLGGDGGYAFKIAYDEAYSKYSPGVQLEVENICQLHKRADVAWMDSCAVANHPMINRVWGERRMIQKVLVSPGGWRNNAIVDTIATLASLRRLLKCR